MIFPLAGLLIGAILGALRAKMRGGTTFDLLQWGAVFAMGFGLIGLFILSSSNALQSKAMFLPFFDNLRNAGVPVSLREFLAFLEGMKKGLATYDIDAFYYLGCAIMVKDERHLDRFDRAFAATFSGLEAIPPQAVMDAKTCFQFLDRAKCSANFHSLIQAHAHLLPQQ